MSGFAALTGFEGDSDDVLAAHKKREADEEKARAAEVEATRARFDKLKASAGATNWADSDEDDDAFFGKPPGLGGPPGLQVRLHSLLSCLFCICTTATTNMFPPCAGAGDRRWQ